MTCGEQRVLQQSHLAQKFQVSVLLRYLADSYIKYVTSVRNETFTLRATSLSSTYGQIDTGRLE